MDDKEIIEFLKQNKENNYQLGIAANLYTIINILIQNKLTTQDIYKELKEQALEKIRQEQVNRMTEEERKQLETLKTFNSLFGNL